MIGFQDFEPKEMPPSGFLRLAEYQSLDETSGAANRWINEHDVHVVNIETVVLPSMRSRYEEGTTDAEPRDSGEFHTPWHQLGRAWYRY